MGSILSNAPMSWKEFKALPETRQKEYLTELIQKYKVGPTALAQMFGTGSMTVTKHVKGKLGMEFPSHSSANNNKRFIETFCTPPEAAPQKAVKAKRTKKAAPPEANPVPVTAAAAAPSMTLTKTSLSFAGPFCAQSVANKLAALFAEGSGVKVTIEIETID